MYRKILKRWQADFPVRFVMESIAKIHETDRWFSSDKMLKTCRTVEKIMKEIGLTDVKTIYYPADAIRLRIRNLSTPLLKCTLIYEKRRLP